MGVRTADELKIVRYQEKQRRGGHIAESARYGESLEPRAGCRGDGICSELGLGRERKRDGRLETPVEEERTRVDRISLSVLYAFQFKTLLYCNPTMVGGKEEGYSYY